MSSSAPEPDFVARLRSGYGRRSATTSQEVSDALAASRAVSRQNPGDGELARDANRLVHQQQRREGEARRERLESLGSKWGFGGGRRKRERKQQEREAAREARAQRDALAVKIPPSPKG